MLGSFLYSIHPMPMLKTLSQMGPGAALCLIVLGVWIGFNAIRSVRTSSWLFAVSLLALSAVSFFLGGKLFNYWLVAAIAGTFLLFWTPLTPLFSILEKDLTPFFGYLACYWLLNDVAGYVAIYSLKSGVIGVSGTTWHLSLLLGFAVIAVLGLNKAPERERMLIQLSLTYAAVNLALAGLAGYGVFKQLPTLYTSPLLLVTAVTASVVVFHLVTRGFSNRPDLLERYRPHQGMFATQLFLVLFTLATLYPVLGVVKMAATPQKGFSMGLNPIPSTMQNYFNTTLAGDHNAARCYRRAMVQNFTELLGVGQACYDEVCRVYRIHKDTKILKQQESICKSFFAVWKIKDKDKREDAVSDWRDKHLDKLTEGTVAHKRMEKLLQNVEYKQGKREKDGSLFWKQLLNSVIVALVTTFLGLLLACTAAYAFSRFRFPGRQTGLMSFLVSQMFPGTLMMIPLYILMSKLGLLDNLLGLSLVYSTTAIPFCVWMLKGYFDTIPREIEEAALIDGASRTLIFWKIMLPLARPAIAVTALFSFMTAWNEFILAATFMNEETSYTLPVMLYKFVGPHDTDWGHFAAAAILVSLPIIFLFFALQKNLVSGLTAGGVKG